MRAFVAIATLFLASICSALPYGTVSTQYHAQDHLGGYSYGYADPNSKKHESRSADGVTHGGYSYVDGNGHIQSVSYTADPHTGFHVSGTNLPEHHAAALGPAPLAYAAYAAPWTHQAHISLTPHGVPADTPEVSAAKAAHFAAHAAALSGHHLHKRSLWGGHAYAAPWAHAHNPVIHNGVPVETPEVQHAKAAHFAAHSKALAQTHAAPYGHYNGAPVDTPEVQHAKAAHFAAHAAARTGHHGGGDYHGSGDYHGAGAYHGGGAYHGAIHIPVIHNGVPVDTPEVQHAKAAHFAAVSEVSARAGHGGGDHHYSAGHHGPIHIPVIHQGVPVDTPEVQHAKAAHFAAVAAAHSGSYGHNHYDHGHQDDGSYHHHDW